MAATALRGEQWKCSDRACDSGQTFLDREQFGRKVISDFFGRNKTATKAIPDDVWHWQCRKHYQRAKYAADNGTAEDHKAFFLGHLRAQVTRIGLWRPGATFTIRRSRVTPKTGRKAKASSSPSTDPLPPRHAEKIDQDFAGENRSLAFISGTIFPWIDAEFASGRMTRMPPIEFLINGPTEREVITPPHENYARWIAHVDGVSDFSTGPVHLSSSSGSKRKAEDEEVSPKTKRPRVILRVRSRSPLPLSDEEAASILMSMRNSERVKASLPLYIPPPPPVSSSKTAKHDTEGEQQTGTFSELPLYVPPPSIVHHGILSKAISASSTKPIMARGMVYAGAKTARDYDSDDYESDDE